ncbi:MAG TPA: histidine kinase dimerization/phospho-acceptor domain-containing protein [Actinomycetota bacterium]
MDHRTGDTHRPLGPADRSIPIVGFLAAAVAGASVLLPVAPAPTTSQLIEAGILLALFVAGELAAVRIAYRSEVVAVSLGGAILAPAILAYPVIAVIAIALAGQLVAGALGARGRRRTSINAARWTLAAGLAAILFQALRAGEALGIRNVAALTAALTLLVVMKELGSGVSVHTRARDDVPSEALSAPSFVAGWALNTSFGLLLAGAVQTWTLAVVPFAVTLLVLHWATRSQAEAAVERDLLRRRIAVHDALASTADLARAIPRALAVIREALDCDVVDLVLIEDGSRVRHRLGPLPGGYDRADVAEIASLADALLVSSGPALIGSGPREDLGRMLAAEGWRTCASAPVRARDGVLGVLIAFSRLEGFDRRDLALLESFAAPVAAAVERARTGEARLAERQGLTELVDNAPDGIFTIDAAGAVRAWNPAMEEISGHLAGEIAAAGIAALDLRTASGERADLTAATETLPTELRITTRPGEQKWLSCSFARIHASGEDDRLIVTARDTTRQHTLERIKAEFVATLAQELRAPLTPVKGWAATLRQVGDRLAPAIREEAADAILEQAATLEQLIGNLQELSRIEESVIDLRDHELDVRAVVSRLVADVQAESGREIRFTPGSKPHLAIGDEGWLARILANLLENAMHASPANRPLHVAVTSVPGAVRISLGGAPAKRRRKGVAAGIHPAPAPDGIGIYVARQLASAIGADLSVEPNGGSSTFEVTLRAPADFARVS